MDSPPAGVKNQNIVGIEMNYLAPSKEEARIELYEQRLNDAQIAQKFELDPSTIRHWRRSRGLKPNCSRGQINKVSLEPTEELGYLCGLIMGDGSIYFARKTRNYRIIFSSTKKEFIELASEAIRKIGLRTCSTESMRTRRFPNGEVRTDKEYRVQANTKILYQALISYKGNKNKSWGIPKFLSTREGLVGFLKGIYDAEGSATTNIFRKQLWICITSKFKEGLLEVKEILHKMGIDATLVEGKNCCWLYTLRKKSQRRFAELVGFNLSWKKDKLEGGLKLVSLW